MTQARSTLIDYQATRYYHTISRCIRRAYLCGKDEVTGKSFEHRRQWLVDRFKFLAESIVVTVLRGQPDPPKVQLFIFFASLSNILFQH